MNTSPSTSKLLLVADQRTPAPRGEVGPVRRYRIARMRFDDAVLRPADLSGHDKQ